MRDGDLDSVLKLHDSEAVFLNQRGETKSGKHLREELIALAAAKTVFDFRINEVIQSGDIALMHTQWRVSAPVPQSLYAIEVARRQKDGSWRWLIGDPYSVGKFNSAISPESSVSENITRKEASFGN